MVSITFKGTKIDLKGKEVNVGDTAEDFTLINTAMDEVSLSNFDGKKKLISVVPSLDTGVCQLQTKNFYKEAADVDNAVLITISNDLPFAQARFCADADLDNAVTLSDHRNLEFAEKYGTLMEPLRLQARSVFVLDENNKVVYVEYVPEGTDEPDYDKAIEALKNA